MQLLSQVPSQQEKRKVPRPSWYLARWSSYLGFFYKTFLAFLDLWIIFDWVDSFMILSLNNEHGISLYVFFVFFKHNWVKFLNFLLNCLTNLFIKYLVLGSLPFGCCYKFFITISNFFVAIIHEYHWFLYFESVSSNIANIKCNSLP